MINDMIQRDIPCGRKKKSQKEVDKENKVISDEIDAENIDIKYLLVDTLYNRLDLIMLEKNIIISIDYKEDKTADIGIAQIEESYYKKIVENNRDKFSWGNSTSKNEGKQLIKKYEDLDEKGVCGMEKESIEKIVNVALG